VKVAYCSSFCGFGSETVPRVRVGFDGFAKLVDKSNIGPDKDVVWVWSILTTPQWLLVYDEAAVWQHSQTPNKRIVLEATTDAACCSLYTYPFIGHR